MKIALVVDANDDSRAIFGTILRWYGYGVIEARDGGEAVQLARERLPDIVLTEVTIPVLDGWNAAAILRDDPVTRGIPLVAVTTQGLEADRARAASLGFAAYLVKPIEPRALAEAVRRIIGPPDPGGEPRVSPLRSDP